MKPISLYSFFRSSAAWRVRIALELKGLEYETIPINLRAGEHRETAFLARNPGGLVPAIELEGSVLTQSLAIIEYLDERFPEPRLLPDDPLARARVRAFALQIACEIHPLNNLRTLKFLTSNLGLEESQVHGEWYKHWIIEGFRAP